MAGIDSFTTLCVHFDGANGSTIYVDSSSANNPVFDSTEGGFIDTSTFEFGGASYNNPALSGLNCVYSVANSAAYSFGTGDFVIDLWFKPAGFSSCALLDFGFNVSGESGSCPLIYMNDAQICWYFNGGIQIGGATLSTGTWYHIAVVRSSSVTRLFVDGVQSGSDYVDTNSYGSDAGVGWMLGAVMNGGGAAHAPQVLGASQSGWFDELRFSKGTDRGWFSGFTPPTAAYSASGNSFSQTVSVSSTSTSAFQRGIAKLTPIGSTTASAFARATAKKLPIASASTSAFQRGTAKVVPIQSTSASSFARATGKLVSVGSSSVTSFVRATAKAVSIASSSATSFQRGIGHLVSVTSETATTASSGLIHLVTVLVQSTTSSSFVRSVGKLLPIGSASQTTMGRSVAKDVSVQSTSQSSFRKAVAKSLSIGSLTQTLASWVQSVLGNFFPTGLPTPSRTAVAFAQPRVVLAWERPRLVTLVGRGRTVFPPQDNRTATPN